MSTGTPSEQELVLPAPDGLGLTGTLTLPTGDGPFPAALLLGGSGPLDRDSDAGRRMRLGLGRPLARALAAHGVASVRYDRRGVGATGGGDWRAVGFRQNRDDAAAALRGLREHPAVRADAAAVVGHSEGALHAAALGAREDPAAVVLLAPTARPGADVLRWQAAQLAGDLPTPVRLLLRVLRTDLSAQQARNARRILATTTDIARVGRVQVYARLHREFMAHDPRPDLAALRGRVLAVTGGKDLQVPPEDLDVVAELSPGAEIRRVPDLTHILRRDTAPASMRRYRALLREPGDAQLLADVAAGPAAAL
ncbi:MAG: alpha/beta hydrolase, partial [Pseudonocardia sp.]|nr:alpha/beta hydrolase [Pseudonocardia sp.]